MRDIKYILDYYSVENTMEDYSGLSFGHGVFCKGVDDFLELGYDTAPDSLLEELKFWLRRPKYD